MGPAGSIGGVQGEVAELLLGRVEGFALLLRANGFRVSVADTASAIEALACLGADHESLYWALRMGLVKDQTEIEPFDRLFREYWSASDEGDRDEGADAEGAEQVPVETPHLPDDEHDRQGSAATGGIERLAPEGGQGGEEPAPIAAYSADEILHAKDFAQYDEADYRRLVNALERLDQKGPQRLSRRYRAHRRGPIDIRRTMIAGFKTDGYPIRRRHYQRRPSPRPVAFVCDVSGSMREYALPILLFARAMARQRGHVATFAFATRLHPLTEALALEEVGRALEAAVERVVDWSGGTRIGESVEALNRDHSPDLRGAVVVIASDGWDLGDSPRLEREMERLKLFSHRIIWLNPNLQDSQFEPLTQGMATALPFVDRMISCHQYANFEALNELLTVRSFAPALGSAGW